MTLRSIFSYKCSCLADRPEKHIEQESDTKNREITHQSKWKSFETSILKSKKFSDANFSAMFFTATLDCATSHTACVMSLEAMTLVTAAAMTVVLPVPGGPCISPTLSASLVERIKLTAFVCEGFRGRDERMDIGLLNAGESAQERASFGSQMRLVNECFKMLIRPCRAIRTISDLDASAWVGSSLPTVVTEAMLLPENWPFTEICTARPLTRVARPV